MLSSKPNSKLVGSSGTPSCTTNSLRSTKFSVNEHIYEGQLNSDEANDSLQNLVPPGLFNRNPLENGLLRSLPAAQARQRYRETGNDPIPRFNGSTQYHNSGFYATSLGSYRSPTLEQVIHTQIPQHSGDTHFQTGQNTAESNIPPNPQQLIQNKKKPRHLLFITSLLFVQIGIISMSAALGGILIKRNGDNKILMGSRILFWFVCSISAGLWGLFTSIITFSVGNRLQRWQDAIGAGEIEILCVEDQPARIQNPQEG